MHIVFALISRTWQGKFIYMYYVEYLAEDTLEKQPSLYTSYFNYEALFFYQRKCIC